MASVGENGELGQAGRTVGQTVPFTASGSSSGARSGYGISCISGGSWGTEDKRDFRAVREDQSLRFEDPRVRQGMGWGAEPGIQFQNELCDLG